MNCNLEEIIMMQKLSNDSALGHMDALMNKVSVAKTASSLEEVGDTGGVAGCPAGTYKIPLAKDSDACDKKEEVNPAEGTFASEKHQDLKDSTDAEEVEDMAENTDGDPAEVPTDFNVSSIDKKSGEKRMKEQERVNRQGQAILAKLPNNGVNEFEKLSAEDQEAAILFKEAADEHYMDYVSSYAAGMQKKAEDVEALMEAQGLPAEEAEAVLDDVATDDPSLVIPEEEEEMEEGMEGMEGMEEGDMEMLSELANELEAAGVTPEEVAQAVAEIEEEEGGMEEGMEEEVEKLAYERNDAIKEAIRAARY